MEGIEKREVSHPVPDRERRSVMRKWGSLGDAITIAMRQCTARVRKIADTSGVLDFLLHIRSDTSSRQSRAYMGMPGGPRVPSRVSLDATRAFALPRHSRGVLHLLCISRAYDHL